MPRRFVFTVSSTSDIGANPGLSHGYIPQRQSNVGMERLEKNAKKPEIMGGGTVRNARIVHRNDYFAHLLA
jgi:hypothetical protein